ncbi:MAG: CBS domain-containing protein [Bdellovibrionales bacterium]|nr:CBS domain-containing protein [Bdellovibrionales bacterium]
MKKNEPITKIATKNPYSVHTGQKLSEVRHLFKEKGVHHCPVVSGDKLIGIISATDILALSFEAFGTDERSIDSVLDNRFTIEEVMQADVVSVLENDTVRKAAEILSEGRFHSLPVVSSQGELKGIVTSTDLIRYLVDQY